MTAPRGLDYAQEAKALRGLWEEGPDAAFAVNADGVILMVNRQAELLTGLDREDMIGRPVEILVPEGLRDKHRDHRSGYVMNPHRRLMGPDLALSILQRGEGVPVDVNLAPIVVPGLGVIVAATVRPRGISRWGGA